MNFFAGFNHIHVASTQQTYWSVACVLGIMDTPVYTGFTVGFSFPALKIWRVLQWSWLLLNETSDYCILWRKRDKGLCIGILESLLKIFLQLLSEAVQKADRKKQTFPEPIKKEYQRPEDIGVNKSTQDQTLGLQEYQDFNFPVPQHKEDIS